MPTLAQTNRFHLRRSHQGDVQILSLSGHLSNDEFGRVDTELTHLIEQRQSRVILDLTLLSSATTMSLARLLICGCEFRRNGGVLKLAGLSPWLRHVAELAGFDRKHDFAADVPTALAEISQL